MPALRRLVAFVVLLVAAVGWAGCGGAPPSRATTAKAPNAIAIGAGTSGDYPPLSRWTGARPEGYAPALLESFAAREHADVRWSRFTWPELLADLRAGRFDVAADGITVRAERSIAGRFTVPIAKGGAVLLLRRPAWASPPTGADALAIVRAIDRPELEVVVNAGGHLERVARSLFHAAKVRAIPDNTKVRDVLARREADAAMTNTFEAPRWAEGLADVERVGPLSRDVTALWVRADRADLAERLDAWLLAEEESGRLGEMRRRLLGEGGGGPTATPVSALLAATAERLALMPFVAAAKQRAGKAVEDTAQEERVLAASREAVAKAAASHGVAPPPSERVDAFFRAQIEAAKVVQQRAPAPPSATYSLDADLRPAIARISARMAFLVVRVPRSVAREDVVREAREDLGESGLDAAGIDAIATAVAALGH